MPGEKKKFGYSITSYFNSAAKPAKDNATSPPKSMTRMLFGKARERLMCKPVVTKETVKPSPEPAAGQQKRPRFGRSQQSKGSPDKSSDPSFINKFAAETVHVELEGESSEDEPIRRRPKKKRKLLDSDDDYEPSDAKSPDNLNVGDCDNISAEAKNPDEMPASSECGSSLTQFAQGQGFGKFSRANPEKLANSTAKIEQADRAYHRNDARAYDWFNNRKDLSMNPQFLPDGKENPAFNPCEWYVPKEDKKKFSKMHQLWWDIKGTNADAIIFLKVGKFYEIFREDAEICHQLLDLRYMRDEGCRHVGIPEKTFERRVQTLIDHGYKVIRVEQTQDAKTVQKGKAVKRDICQVLTSGTMVGDGFEPDSSSRSLLALCEQVDEANNETNFGVAVVDIATARFSIGFFHDLATRAKLRTMLAQFKPREVIWLKESLDAATVSALESDLNGSDLRLEGLQRDRWWELDRATRQIQKAGYFSKKDELEPGRGGKWPEVLKQVINEKNLAADAFAGLLGYLNHTLVDEQLMSQERFELYDVELRENGMRGLNMFLDGATLTNLEILETQDGKLKGSLFHFIKHTQTAFGGRMLRMWLAKPLIDSERISERHECIQNLIDCPDLAEDMSEKLRGFSDMERLLSQIFKNSTNTMMDKAFMFCDALDKKKTEQFRRLIESFIHAVALFRNMQEYKNQIRAKRLIHLMTPGEGYKPFEGLIEEFRNKYDISELNQNLILIPAPGSYKEFDECNKVLALLKREEMRHLQSCRSRFDSTLKYKHNSNSKSRLLIEAPTNMPTPEGWIQKKASKKFVHYCTPEIEEFDRKFDLTTRQKDKFLDNFAKKLYFEFSCRRATWDSVVKAIGEIDCLTSLYHTAQFCGLSMCCPKFLPQGERPFLHIVDGKHPTAKASSYAGSGGEMIPNDCMLGTEKNKATFMLLTGPNMGGKSTFLRQTCALVILSQIGSFVPAASITLTPVDQIFTRIGANDRILSGQSTFMVELDETSRILQKSTKHSLVVLDELGRGTSTFDGTAIAYAVAKHLTESIGCRTIFATHYHVLGADFQKDPRYATFYMDFLLDGIDVTFLYKCVKGVCTHSHGINCARIAGLNKEIIDRAKQISDAFDAKLQKKAVQCCSNTSMRVDDKPGGGCVEKKKFYIKVAKALAEGDMNVIKNIWGSGALEAQ